MKPQFNSLFSYRAWQFLSQKLRGRPNEADRLLQKPRPISQPPELPFIIGKSHVSAVSAEAAPSFSADAR